MATAPTLQAGESRPLTAAFEMSIEEYRAASFDGVAEWVDGCVEVDMSVGKPHFLAVDFLQRFLNGYLLVQPLGRLLAEPFGMRASAGGNVRLPDLFFVTNDHMERFGEDQLDGPADLCIEVVSPGSFAKDYQTKFFEYQANGVREYWIINPNSAPEHAEFHVLAPDPVHRGHLTFRPVPIDDDGIYRSSVIEGLWIRVGWLWDRDADPQQCLAEVVGVDAMVAAVRAKAASNR